MVETGRMKGTSVEARSINSHLDVTRTQIINSQLELQQKNIAVTSDILKNKILGIDERSEILIPIFKDYNNKIKELVGKEYAPRTLERYKTSLSHTVEFLQWKYKISDIEITKIDHAFVTDYEFWLRSVRNCANNTAVKYIKNFSKIIKICLANNWIERNPFIHKVITKISCCQF